MIITETAANVGRRYGEHLRLVAEGHQISITKNGKPRGAMVASPADAMSLDDGTKWRVILSSQDARSLIGASVDAHREGGLPTLVTLRGEPVAVMGSCSLLDEVG